MPLDVALQQAVAHHQAGRLQEAEQLYRAILQALPSQPDANHNLGVLAGQVGQHAAGLPYLKIALETNPAQGQYVLSYAGALLATGQAGEARDMLQAAMQCGLNTPAAQALRQKIEAALRGGAAKNEAPTSAEINQLAALFNAGQHAELECRARLLLERIPHSGLAWKVLGVSLHMQGKDALPALQKAAELLPGDAEVHGNLGNVLLGLGQLDGAVASCRRALEIKPDFAEAHNNLGNALRDLGRLDDAVASYRWALEIKPDLAEAHYNLGNALQDLWELDGAVASYARALKIRPDYAEAHSNLGLALQDLGQFDRAAACHVQALNIRPDYAEAHYNLGNALQNLGQFEGAAASHRRALEIEPDHAKACNNLGNALKDLDQLDNAMASYRRALEIKPDYAQAFSNLLFAYNFLAGYSPEEMPTEARRFGELVSRQARPHAIWCNTPIPARCLRVGLVSGDMRNHPVGFFLESLLAHIAPACLELIAYPAHRFEDELTARIKSRFSAWKPLTGLSDETAANLIHADGIDILIDLSGHTANNRLPLFAWKPAPVQVSWLGYFATTGVAAMDYFIADPWTAPETEESHFTETIRRLPETYLCFTPPDADAPIASLPALANGHITFGCFNNLTKMNDTVVALWARVLLATPGSRLYLKTKQLGEASVRQRTLARFAAHGIDADRLILEGAAPRAELLASYRRVDIALDPFPYPGGATSAEALWMGVPVLTLAGRRFLSHIGESILQNAGLPEWIATNADDYVARAAWHAGDVQRLATLRDGLRQQVLASPLFDAPRFAHHFETALRDMWREWCGSRMA
ncbi:MAG: tetratricopeptide repeat protein [Sulfuricellaceae bacterium]